MAIKCFFIISGYLITSSYYSNAFNIKQYYVNRFSRIYPAYFVVVCLSFLLFSFMSDLSLAQYFQSINNLKYLFVNVVFLNFLQPGLEGVFEHNPIHAVNGSLWTIKIEVMFYVLLPLIVTFIHRLSLKNKLLFLGMIFFGSELYSYFFSHVIVNPIIEKQLPGHMNLFACGITCFYLRDGLKKYSKYLLLPAVVVYLLEDHFLQVEFLKPVALSIFILFIAYNFKALNTFGKYGDFSYGIYLIHFPVIQALIEFGVFPQNPAYFLAISIVLVLVLGICSWHLVEKPSLITFKKLANKQLR